MSEAEDRENILLIASVSPQNLERDDLWWTENRDAIRKALHTNPWWRAVQGGIVEIWPINAEHAYALEFAGNAIAAIHRKDRPAIEAKPHYRGFASIERLAEGSFVVHADHGIGIFGGVSSEKPGFFSIRYAPPATGGEPDKLFVPIDQKDRLTPYVGFTTPHVHRLGESFWINTRRKVREDTEKLARELLALYANRHETRRPPYATDESYMEQLRESFSYETTEGQQRAEQEIMRDMDAERPMDRVLVGDVGFGKTEIAIRVAAAAVFAGRQVAVLSPTTVLAVQHERTFRERLSSFPVSVRLLSRLTPREESKEILRLLAEGKVDCVIGTHRLLSSDIIFKNLGLVIIDEEQRFGVKQKERCKELRTEVDMLSLSATPIPRTLSLALAKLRDISRIDTPPHGRIPITTAVLPHNKKIIRDAIALELARGGQIYFLHNRVETIGMVKNKLQKLLSEKVTALPFHSDRNGMGTPKKAPRIGVIHGRIGEKELINIMDAFRNREIDILLATTIIENGLDISSANTLIVGDAARLGLAQAHQLRGRIGRGETQAYAYFLYKPQRLTEKGSRRLDALQEYALLGNGYDIALRDLEIRGAGNVLGREQSGAVNKVGLNLYCQMLAEAVEQMRH
ncbi:MAG: transcription-repair coupling factor [Parcubacteria group bacterium Greene0714_36]|nr:MAG: transcription-repair coupling factor [Parcubacteria group bacterium Greene0714_36]